MFVDVKLRVAQAHKVAYLIRHGPVYTNQKSAQTRVWWAEYRQLVRWAQRKKIRTGKWIMCFLDEWEEKPESKRRSVACLEINGNPKPEGNIKIMKLPKERVVSVMFDPTKISADLIYYGIEGWLWYSKYKQAGPYREVYNGNPWTNTLAWKNAEIQVPLKRK
jgi:DNA gyrase inhibitor GyrI